MPINPDELNKGLLSFQNEVVDPTGQDRGTGGSVVRRYTAPTPTAPVPAALNPQITPQVPPTPATTPTTTPPSEIDQYYSGLNRTAPTATDEQSIRDNIAKSMQTRIDAIDAHYNTLVSQENQNGQDRLGQTRAINARSGLGGSDFGNTNINQTTDLNKKAVAAIEEERNLQKEAIFNNIDQRAQQAIEAKKAEAAGNAQAYIQHLEQSQTQARQDLTTLAQAGTRLESLNPDQKAALLKQTGYDPLTFEAVFNANKPKAQQIDYKFEKLADGKVLFYGVDPTDGQLKQQVFDYDIPPDFQMVIAPDGTPLLYNKNTGESKIAGDFQQGQFAKQEQVDPLDQQLKIAQIQKIQNEINSNDGLLPTEKDRAAFNQIVGKYNASPLIAAADRTTVLKNTIKAIKQNPNDATLQLNLSYGYIQALDTYQSAVREGELSNLNSVDSNIGKLQNYIQQMTQGQVVRPEIAKQIADAADNLIQYINEGAKQKEQVFASQARVNGIEGAWNEFRSGFTTNYDEQPPQLTRIYGSSPNKILQKYPYQEVADYIKAHPNATEDDIKQGFKELGVTDFNSVGGDTKQASSKELMSYIGNAQPSNIALATAKTYPVGSVGGQCTTFLHKIADFPSIGDGKTEKFASVDKFGIPASQWRNNVQVGDIIVTGENQTYGHTAMVNAILSDGRIQLTESNYHLNEKVTYNRIISPNDKKIYGAIRPKLKSQLT